MFGEQHDILHEFPEYKKQIQILQEQDDDFKILCIEYHALDNEVRAIEQNIKVVTDEYVENLKKKRVLLKDQIYAILHNQND